jgi:hypothetical protein
MKISGDRCLHPFYLKISYIFLLLIAVISLGCGKDRVKPSEDSILAQGAIRSTERIKEAYETKNLVSVSALIESGLFSKLEKELNFDKADLTFSLPRIIRISSSHVTTSINWEGVWERGEVTTKNRGSTNFVFLKDSMRLVEIDGDNPFAVPPVNMQ